MKSYLYVFSIILTVIIAMTGWILNLVALVNADGFSGLVLARAIGVVVAPIGIALGLFV